MKLKEKDLWLGNLLKKDCYIIRNPFSKINLNAKSFYTYKSKIKINKKNDYSLILISITLLLKKELSRKFECNHKVIQLRSIRKFGDSLVNLSKNNFIHSRFELDKKIPKKIVNLIFYRWLKDSIKSKKKEFYGIVNSQNKIVSCIIIKKNFDKIQIDLTASSKRYRGRGYAGSILSHIINKYKSNDIVVGTEKNNLPALKLYRKFNFKQIEKKFVYHLHT